MNKSSWYPANLSGLAHVVDIKASASIHSNNHRAGSHSIFGSRRDTNGTPIAIAAQRGAYAAESIGGQ